MLSSLSKSDAATKGAKQFGKPQALSALATLGMLQPWTFKLLNHLVSLVLTSDYYINNDYSYMV